MERDGQDLSPGHTVRIAVSSVVCSESMFKKKRENHHILLSLPPSSAPLFILARTRVFLGSLSLTQLSSSVYISVDASRSLQLDPVSLSVNLRHDAVVFIHFVFILANFQPFDSLCFPPLSGP